MILPGIIAYYTNHRRKRLIAIISLLLGWTVFVGMFTLTMVITQALKETKIDKWAEKNKKNIGRTVGALAVIVVIYSIIEIMQR